MDLDDFLHGRGTDLRGVITAVETTLGIGAGDVLLAVGSLVEGLGTPKSDVDLMLVTPRPLSAIAPDGFATLVVGRSLIDVSVLSLNEIGEFLQRFETWSQLPWNVSHQMRFTLEERTLLHRLLHGRILHKPEGDSFLTRLPSIKDLSRLKFHVARHMARTIQVDMVGYTATPDYRSLVFAAQDLLGHAVDALLAGCGRTNPVSKWRSRLLDSLPADWEHPLPVRPTGLTAGERVWNLHRAPGQADSTSCLTHAFQITSFARAIFVWAERALGLVSGGPDVPRMRWTPTQPMAHGLAHSLSPKLALPYLNFDVDFVFVDGRIAIAQLNEFGEALWLSPREFFAALLFDGTTTAVEAEGAVQEFPHEAIDISENTIEHLLKRIADAGLSVSLTGQTQIVGAA